MAEAGVGLVGEGYSSVSTSLEAGCWLKEDIFGVDLRGQSSWESSDIGKCRLYALCD